MIGSPLSSNESPSSIEYSINPRALSMGTRSQVDILITKANKAIIFSGHVTAISGK